MDAQDLQEANAQIEQLLSVREDLRNEERSLRARAQTLASQPQVKKQNLRQALGSYLPPGLMPGNVGSLNSVVWPFWFTVDFDFGTDYTLVGGTTNQTQNFQVTQEAAILLVACARQADNYDLSGHLGPWNITIRDNQSSRQFNDTPVPIQQISYAAGLPTKLPTAMLLMPNASISVVMTTWLPQGVSMPTTGPTHQQFSFFGYRVRIEDSDKVMSSVFLPARISGGST
jgi:hypothetical protein